MTTTTLPSQLLANLDRITDDTTGKLQEALDVLQLASELIVEKHEIVRLTEEERSDLRVAFNCVYDAVELIGELLRSRP